MTPACTKIRLAFSPLLIISVSLNAIRGPCHHDSIARDKLSKQPNPVLSL